MHVGHDPAGDHDPVRVNEEIIPPSARALDLAAAGSQRSAHRAQAAHLGVLVTIPVLRLAALPFPDLLALADVATAVLLLLAQGLKFGMRWAAPDTDWVRARLDVETAKSAAWRRCAVGTAEETDSEFCRAAAAQSWNLRWDLYRSCRIDDQIAYFDRRGGRHRAAARRWRAVQLLLTVTALLALALQALALAPSAVVGLVLTLLAVSEAWQQFNRSELLAAGFAVAAAQLRELRETHVGADGAAFGELIDETEHVLEQERWMWVALRSTTVLMTKAST